MEWDELIGLFVDERVDAILEKGRPGRHSHWERKLFASLDGQAKEQLEAAVVGQAEKEAKECAAVYRRAFLDGLYVGARAFGGREKAGTKETQ